jgi:HD-GYP domain-containing protein (c-di-GMP phosphodiesterase class II)
MNSPKGTRHTVTMDQLCVGLHIRLDGWSGHPFLFSSFKIKDQKQIDTLKSMGLTELEYLPQKSDAQPPAPAAVAAPVKDQAAPDAATLAMQELMKEKQERIDSLNKARERIQAAEKKYTKTASAVKNVMRLANNNPAQAAQQAAEVAGELAEIFLAKQNPYIHLMGDNEADESAHFHSLNVTVLSLILGRAVGIEDPQTMRDIAQGAVLHDVGKAMIPSQVLLKDDLTTAEAKLLQMHPGYGVKLMQPVETLPRRVREIIFFHHELYDGSGFPKGLKGEAVDQCVRIVTIANVYDNLCNQRIKARGKTPSEALSFMYKNELAKYDKGLLSAFIKSMGIYPPGTIVVLKSGKVGIVMSVDASDLLHPNLMIYDQAIPKQQAAVVNLRRDLEDSVDRTLRPSALPQPIFDYLSPRKRISYFVDNAGPG